MAKRDFSTPRFKLYQKWNLEFLGTAHAFLFVMNFKQRKFISEMLSTNMHSQSLASVGGIHILGSLLVSRIGG